MLGKLFQSKLLSFANSTEIKCIVLFAMACRFLLFAFYLHTTKVPDSFSFIELGDRLLDFNLNGYNGQRSPGYPLLYFLALGIGPVVVMYQFIIGTITAVFMYKTLLNYHLSKKISFYAVIIFQTFLHVFFYETTILVETVTLLILVIIFYLLSKNYLESKQFGSKILMAILLSYLVLVKPFYAYLPFLIYGFVLLKKFNLQRAIHQTVIILLPLSCYFGWSYVNKINTGHFVSTTFFGLNIAQNCVHFAEKAPKEFDWIAQPYVKHRELAKAQNKDVAMTIWYAYEAGEYDHKKLNFPDLSHELGKFGKAAIEQNQRDYWQQVVCISFIDFWNVFDIKKHITFKIQGVDNFITAIWETQKIVLTIIKYFFLLLVPFYLVTFIKNRRVTHEFMIVTVVLVTAVLQAIVTFGTNSKYSFPFEFFMVAVVLLFVKKNFFRSKHLNIDGQ